MACAQFFAADRAAGGVGRLENLAFVFADGDSPGGEFDEPSYEVAVRCCTFEHAVDDGGTHCLLILTGQAAVVQQLGQVGQVDEFMAGGLATHPVSVCRGTGAGSHFRHSDTSPPACVVTVKSLSRSGLRIFDG